MSGIYTYDFRELDKVPDGQILILNKHNKTELYVTIEQAKELLEQVNNKLRYRFKQGEKCVSCGYVQDDDEDDKINMHLCMIPDGFEAWICDKCKMEKWPYAKPYKTVSGIDCE